MIQQHLDGVLAVFSGDDVHLESFEHAGHGEDVPDIVVDDAGPSCLQSALMQRLEHLALPFRQLGNVAMQQQRRFIEQSFRRTNILDENGFGQASSAA